MVSPPTRYFTRTAQTGADGLVGPYTDAEHMSLALVDSLICFEMPLFAIAHVGQSKFL